MNDSNHNIKFNYLYRDAGNYKEFDSLIFTNKDSLSIEYIELTIRKKLIEGEYFIPEKWNVPRLSFGNYSPELDHDYHEFESVEQTNGIPSGKCDISEFLSNLYRDMNLNLAAVSGDLQSPLFNRGFVIILILNSSYSG